MIGERGQHARASGVRPDAEITSISAYEAATPEEHDRLAPHLLDMAVRHLGPSDRPRE